MESEDFIEEKEDSSDNTDYSCFGEYGSRTRCDSCKNKLVCKNFTHEKQKAIYLKYKSKYRGRGKARRKDRY